MTGDKGVFEMEKIFVKNCNVSGDIAGDGVLRKVLSYADDLMLCEVTLEKGAAIPSHAHKNIQVTYVVSGSISFTLKNECRVLSKGDTVLSPGNTPHSVEALEDSVCVDVFSPMRNDFI